MAPGVTLLLLKMGRYAVNLGDNTIGTVTSTAVNGYRPELTFPEKQDLAPRHMRQDAVVAVVEAYRRVMGDPP